MMTLTPMPPQFGSNRKWSKGKKPQKPPAPAKDAGTAEQPPKTPLRDKMGPASKRVGKTMRSAGPMLGKGLLGLGGVSAAVTAVGGLAYGSFKSIEDITAHTAITNGYNEPVDQPTQINTAYEALLATDRTAEERLPSNINDRETLAALDAEYRAEMADIKADQEAAVVNFSYELLRITEHNDLAREMIGLQEKLSPEEQKILTQLVQDAYDHADGDPDKTEKFNVLFDQFADQILVNHVEDKALVDQAKADFRKLSADMNMNEGLFVLMLFVWLCVAVVGGLTLEEFL